MNNELSASVVPALVGAAPTVIGFVSRDAIHRDAIHPKRQTPAAHPIKVEPPVPGAQIGVMPLGEIAGMSEMGTASFQDAIDAIKPGPGQGNKSP